MNPTLNQSNRKSGGIGASDQELFSQQGAGLVMDNKANTPELLRMREGCAGGGKGPLTSKNVSLTLGTANDQVLFSMQENSTNTPPHTHKRECARMKAFRGIRDGRQRIDGEMPGLQRRNRPGDRVALWWNGNDRADTLTCTSDGQRMPDNKRLQCIIELDGNTDGNETKNPPSAE